MDGDWFEAYVTQLRAPKLRSAEIAIRNNLSSPNGARACEWIKMAGGPPFASPDFNLANKAFGRLKAMLCTPSERIVSGL